jgi:hypothetical protein
MSTDRELLELAARAAGIDPDMAGPNTPREWNPITDDGDALRLAVRLNLIVHKGFVYTPTGKLFCLRDYASPLAATRRAIVRAAAEIGRNMK